MGVQYTSTPASACTKTTVPTIGTAPKPARNGTTTNRPANSANWAAASPSTAGTATPSRGKAPRPRPTAVALGAPCTTFLNPAASCRWPKPYANNQSAYWPNRPTRAPTTSTRTRCGSTNPKPRRSTHWPGTTATTSAPRRN